MARKKRDEPGPNGTVGTMTTEANGIAADPAATEQAPPTATCGGQPNRPVKSIAVPVGEGVRIEGSIWPREITLDGKPVTVYSATIRKTYRGEDGEYRHTGSYRGSELPVVQYVLGCCAEWILTQRLEEDPPF
jgi:hypothetical protein